MARIKLTRIDLSDFKPEPRPGYTLSYDSTWPKTPLSVERVFTDARYSEWAREAYGERHVARLMLETLKASQGRKYRREDAIEEIAHLFGMEFSSLKSLLNRSINRLPTKRGRRSRRI